MGDDKEIMLWLHASMFFALKENFSFVAGGCAKWIIKWK